MKKFTSTDVEFFSILILLIATFIVYIKYTLPYINTLDTTYTRDTLIGIGLLLVHIFIPTIPSIIMHFLEKPDEKK